VPMFLSECGGLSSVAICIMALAVVVVVSVWVLQLLMWAADVDDRGVVASMGDWGVVLGAMGAGWGLFFVWVAVLLVLGVVCILKSAGSAIFAFFIRVGPLSSSSSIWVATHRHLGVVVVCVAVTSVWGAAWVLTLIQVVVAVWVSTSTVVMALVWVSASSRRTTP